MSFVVCLTTLGCMSLFARVGVVGCFCLLDFDLGVAVLLRMLIGIDTLLGLGLVFRFNF